MAGAADASADGGGETLADTRSVSRSLWWRAATESSAGDVVVDNLDKNSPISWGARASEVAEGGRTRSILTTTSVSESSPSRCEIVEKRSRRATTPPGRTRMIYDSYDHGEQEESLVRAACVARVVVITSQTDMSTSIVWRGCIYIFSV